MSSSNGSPLFEANWGGKCPECEERYKAGAEIGYVEQHDKPVCDDCHRMLDNFVPDPHYYH